MRPQSLPDRHFRMLPKVIADAVRSPKAVSSSCRLPRGQVISISCVCCQMKGAERCQMKRKADESGQIALRSPLRYDVTRHVRRRWSSFSGRSCGQCGKCGEHSGLNEGLDTPLHGDTADFDTLSKKQKYMTKGAAG